MSFIAISFNFSSSYYSIQYHYVRLTAFLLLRGPLNFLPLFQVAVKINLINLCNF